MDSFSNEDLESISPDYYVDLLEGEIREAKQPSEIEIAHHHVGKVACGHQNQNGWVCERSRGHSGLHMLEPGRYPQVHIQSWDNSGQDAEDKYGLLGDESNIQFVGSEAWCGVVGPEGWVCERLTGHTGLHMLEPGKWPEAPAQAWDDDGNARVLDDTLLGDEASEAVQRGIELLNASWGSTDWIKEVDPSIVGETVDEGVLGQLYGDWETGMAELFGDRGEDDLRALSKGAGFTEDTLEYLSAWQEALHSMKLKVKVEDCRKGFDLLTEKLGPGWANEIDITQIDEGDYENCVLGLATGSNYEDGAAQILDNDWTLGTELGFSDTDEDFALMTRAWKQVFSERRDLR